jgi:transglutaminase-like putative cysteine protease
MTPHYQIPRNTLLWLFVTQVVVWLPHFARVPVWVSVLIALCMAWRVQVFRGRLDFPRQSVKVVLTLLCAGGLIMSFPVLLGLEALVSFLFIGYGLKLLEMYKRRDALVLLYLSFFIVMTSFLFEQSMLLAGFNVLAVMVILTALSGLYQQDGHRDMLASFRRAATIVLQALPLMALMFVVLPRVPSFWHMPLNKHTPKTGMSDSMSPGDFTRLVQSADPVMRITFHDAIPPPPEQYWRGLVFSHFDGHRWEASPDDESLLRLGNARAQRRSNFLTPDILPDPVIATIRHAYLPRYRYEVILEETGQPWLFAMDTSLSTSPDVYTTSDFLLLKRDIVNQRFRYEVESYDADIVNPVLDDAQRRRETALPRDSNPRALALALQWKNESVSPDTYIARVLDNYHAQFFYTLRPPALGKDAVDEFLFDSKKGFCEHFAGSFVFLMRAAGIPARVVVGYQGGEMNPYEHYLMVKQYDAHAWAEVWLNGKGWVRYDPTFAVAPQRILDGFHDSFEKSGELPFSLLSLDRYHSNSVLNLLRLQLDKLNYDWARWVLGYDNTRQTLLLEQWLGEYSLTRIVMLFAGASAMFLLLMYAVLLWQERDRSADPVTRQYRRFCRKMQRRGFTPLPAETPQHFLQRLAKDDAKRFAHLADVATLLYRYWFANGRDKVLVAAEIRKQLHP